MNQPISPKLGIIHRLGIYSMVVPMTLPLAAQSTWNGNTSANWSDAANWSPGIPAEGSDIIVSDTTANGLTLDDGSHALGGITFGTTGIRTGGFTFQTTTANTLTLAGGFTALGNFGGTGPRLRGNYVISTDQSFQVGGAQGSHAQDRGAAFNEVSGGNPGTVMLDADLSKSGSGQLTFGATSVSGSGDINLNEGSLKLNAGGSLPLVISGPGKITANFSSTVMLSQNSGTFDITRPFQFNNTATLETGSGTGGKTGIFEIASDMEWNGIHTINNYTNAADYRFTGVMSGSGLVTKSGARHLYLSGTGSNTLNGLFTVAEGELHLDKSGGATAIAGDLLITGGSVRMDQPNQIVDTANVTVTGGQFIDTGGFADTIASISIDSGAVSSLSGITVTGATAITAGNHDVNSGQTFTTDSLSISNNGGLRFVGNNGPSTVNVGPGGLTLDSGNVQFGNAGGAVTNQLNLSGDLVSTGTSQFTAPNYNGPRVLDLQSGSRSFAVNDGTLDIRTTIDNGTLVKSGVGMLVLSQPGSTASFSFTEGSVQIATQADAGNVTLSGGSLLMDVGGVTPAKLTTSGDFTATGGTIEVSADNGTITPGVLELVRYSGALTGSPTINIPTELAASRMAPVVGYGTGSDSAITLTSTAVPLDLTWQGSTGGIWDNNTTSNFDGGSESFFPLDSVTFGDSGLNSAIQLDTSVTPTDVIFDHGDTVATYTLSGTGGIDGPTKLTKSGTGTTILATDNSYTGPTDILGGTLQVGNGGLVGSLGSGDVFVDVDTTLEFARDGVAVIPNQITGSGMIVASGPGTVVFTADSNDYLGDLSITGGTLQIGDGGPTGSLGVGQIDIAAGATFAVHRAGVPTISNSLLGAGELSIIGGEGTSVTGFNGHTGGVSVSDGGVMRAPDDLAFGDFSNDLVPDAIRLDHGGLKNLDSFTVTDFNRGITITDEAYFTAGWGKSLEIGAPITGSGDIFINYDSGTVIFSDETSDWNGILTLGADKPGFNDGTGGYLEISTITNGGVAGPLGIASADPANIVFNGGRLIYSGFTGASDRGFTLQGNGSFNVTLDTLTMNGLATGPGALTKVGDGTLVLGGNNDFTGDVAVIDGVLTLADDNALGAAGKVIYVNGNAASNDYPEMRLSGDISVTVDEIQTSGAGADSTTGVLRNISGNNTLNINNQLTMRTGVSGTTLYSDADTFTINSPLVTANANNRFLTLAGAGDGVLNGAVANGSTPNLPVTKNGAGTWTLNGAHTYTGSTTVNEGVLSLGQAALDDNAAVVIATGAVLDLDFAGIDQVGSLTIGIDPPLADGVYDSSTHPGVITGTGMIRVGVDPAGFSGWAAGFPFTVGVNDGENDDADGDGIVNLLEYVLGGIPVGAGAVDTSILPTQDLTSDDLEFTFLRSDLSESDVTLKVQWSDSLGVWNDFATIGAGDALPAVDVTEDSPNPDFDTVTVTIPRNTTMSGKLFVRLQAVK